MPSREMPLVSGTYIMVKKMKAKLNAPSSTNVAVWPMAPRTSGNTVVMIAFEIQFDAVEQVMPKSLP